MFTSNGSCGPATALDNLSKRVGQDRTLENDHVARFRDQNSSQNRAFRAESSFNTTAGAEFGQFQNTSVQRNYFPSAELIRKNTRFGDNWSSEFRQQQENNKWVEDFGAMNLENVRMEQEQSFQTMDQRTNMQAMSSTANAWTQEFNHMQHNKEMEYEMRIRETQRLVNAPAREVFSMVNQHSQQHNQNFTHNQTQLGDQSHYMTNLAFERQFETVQNEIDGMDMFSDSEQVEQQKELQKEDDNNDIETTKFAEIAQQVFNQMNNVDTTVSQNTEHKFKQSNFLRLMDKVAQREVEINGSGDRFIDKTGNDIRDYLPDPLSDLR
ncbi:Peroxisomal membrane protein [Komagataella phaffii CBS 7435]|uniref:Peroxisome biogenesis protein 20 n=3 Tax=Komagataella TaxID=460517 RepID=PEX20_PICPA|nr:Peroxin 20 [Komagataella phaffii GS115]Q2VUH8.1 RecName: Full=Peroxisome biogenesis protein 20; AltName: Full=Peroxin-20; Short=Pppex20 [Komagataella pastoris]AOA62698.1 GQ67_00501T0 [Komagataella phaffii]CAH2448395.1 Peroxisomal membrane protein [Komagataella phaffii CBS 7435]AAX11696.1 peroxin 20 [Komagataella pastoris]AOA68041.1 GQ68_00887T0 [Komagataella phaffii GS115]CAY69085.1 Peroxin 20 [Komagataella phaffii GS115]